jgi:hypothetical protein
MQPTIENTPDLQNLKFLHCFRVWWGMAADPDPAFYFSADPDPAFHFNADPDPDPVHQSDGNLRPLVYRPPRAPF